MFLTRSMYRLNYFWRNQNIWYFNLINVRNLAVNKNINRILRKRSIWTVLIFYDQIWEGKHLKLRWNLMRKLNGNLVWKLNGIFKTYGHNIFQNFVLVNDQTAQDNFIDDKVFTMQRHFCKMYTFIYMYFDRKIKIYLKKTEI